MHEKPYRWADVPREQVTELFARQLVWGEKVMLAQLDLRKGCIVPKHVHDNEQLSLVTKGVIRFWFGENDERTYDFGPGEVVVIPGGVPHRAEIIEDFEGIDVFSPPRQDWIDGSDAYLRR